MILKGQISNSIKPKISLNRAYTGILKSLSSNLYIIAFLVILILPTFVNFFNLENITELEEKRELATKPPLVLTKEYPQKFESYFNDHFGLRQRIIGFSNKTKLNIFNASPKPELVQLGKNGFLFYNMKDDHIFDSYSNTNIYSQSQLDTAYKMHLSLKKKLDSLNIKYVMGYWPNKHTVYPEYLPFVMKRQIQSDTSLAEQVVKYFNKREISFIDVSKDMTMAKRKNQLYRKFDTHWNKYGAYEAYSSFCRQTFPELGLTSFSLNDFEINYSNSRKGDLTNLLGVDSISNYDEKKPEFVFKGNSFREIKSEGLPAQTTLTTLNENCGNQTVVLVFRDSYTTAFVQFLSLHYYKVIYIWNISPDMKTIQIAEPNIVIAVSVERYLPALLEKPILME